MLDLKAQLAAAGLVTKEEVEAAEAKARKPRRGGPQGSRKRGKKGRSGASGGRKGLNRAALEAAGKGERYDMIRRAVLAQRLDSAGPIPSAASEPFHFAGDGGVVGRVFVEPALRERLEAGTAAIIAFMSNHGLAHAVVPAPLARDIAAVLPEWLRMLRGAPKPSAEAAAESPSESPSEAAPETAPGAASEVAKDDA